MEIFDGNSNCNNNLIIIIKMIMIIILIIIIITIIIIMIRMIIIIIIIRKRIWMIIIATITVKTIFNYCFYIRVFLDASQIWNQVKILVPQERDKIIATAAAAGQQATAWLKEMENAIKVNWNLYGLSPIYFFSNNMIPIFLQFKQFLLWIVFSCIC